jgi:hypothetical protein
MNVSGSQGLREMSFDTDQKTVHKSDINNLARSVKNVLQSSSKMVVALKSQRLTADKVITSMSTLETVRNALLGKYTEITSLEEKMVQSTYVHASFKEDKLNSMAKKIESAFDDLQSAKDFAVERNQFLNVLDKVKIKGEDKGLKLDLNHERKFGWVLDENKEAVK